MSKEVEIRTSQEGTLKAHSDDDGPKVISGYALKFDAAATIWVVLLK
nr:hypothetical protein P5626_17105 [Bacillus subtilis]WGD95105.1 hypothetical protein P5642_20855 [Bacillus subtilis]